MGKTLTSGRYMCGMCVMRWGGIGFLIEKPALAPPKGENLWNYKL